MLSDSIMKRKSRSMLSLRRRQRPESALERISTRNCTVSSNLTTSPNIFNSSGQQRSVSRTFPACLKSLWEHLLETFLRHQVEV